jgi:hypothetical protein
MPALTVEEQQQREQVVRAELARQPVARLVAAGVCPGLEVVDYGLPTQHFVYCERHVGLDGKHDEPTFNMGDTWGLWSDPKRPAGPYHYGLAYVDHGYEGWWQWLAPIGAQWRAPTGTTASGG